MTGAAPTGKNCKALATARAPIFRGLEVCSGQDFAQSGLLYLRRSPLRDGVRELSGVGNLHLEPVALSGLINVVVLIEAEGDRQRSKLGVSSRESCHRLSEGLGDQEWFRDHKHHLHTSLVGHRTDARAESTPKS